MWLGSEALKSRFSRLFYLSISNEDRLDSFGCWIPTLGIGFLSGEEVCSIEKRLMNFSLCRSFKAHVSFRSARHILF